jgi:hypothetical protein
MGGVKGTERLRAEIMTGGTERWPWLQPIKPYADVVVEQPVWDVLFDEPITALDGSTLLVTDERRKLFGTGISVRGDLINIAELVRALSISNAGLTRSGMTGAPLWAYTTGALMEEVQGPVERLGGLKGWIERLTNGATYMFNNGTAAEVRRAGAIDGAPQYDLNYFRFPSPFADAGSNLLGIFSMTLAGYLTDRSRLLSFEANTAPDVTSMRSVLASLLYHLRWAGFGWEAAGVEALRRAPGEVHENTKAFLDDDIEEMRMALSSNWNGDAGITFYLGQADGRTSALRGTMLRTSALRGKMLQVNRDPERWPAYMGIDWRYYGRGIGAEFSDDDVTRFLSAQFDAPIRLTRDVPVAEAKRRSFLGVVHGIDEADAPAGDATDASAAEFVGSETPASDPVLTGAENAAPAGAEAPAVITTVTPRWKI